MTNKFKTIDMVYIAVFAVLIAICSWISIPTTVPFTLQTFAVFLAVGVLGGKRGSLSVLIYILLGAVGIPVFAGFSGGFGILLGPDRWIYCRLFIFCIINVADGKQLLGKKTWVLGLSMVLGLIVCYAIGTVWFMVVYARNSGAVGLATVLGWCVIPFIIPDLIKIVLALALSKRLGKALKLNEN